MYGPASVLPEWLLLGLVLGGLLSALIVVAFVVGTRAFPDDGGRRGGEGGEARRRAEIRRYLRSIGEPFSEDHPVAGHVVAFFLPGRDVAITFDARAYFAIERAGHYAILVEHEMPGAGIGGRLPFETPDVGPADDPAAAAFEVLGVPPSASPREVRDAYRERVKEAHPDQGGDPESFERVREAYSVARERAR